MNTCCDDENKADASFCKICGKPLKRCAACNVLAENDASFCRKCGRPLSAAEGPAEGAQRAADETTPPDPEFGSDVDFSTFAAKRVVPLAGRHGPRRWAREALRVVAVLAAVALLAVVFDTWRRTRTLNASTAAQGEQYQKAIADETAARKAADEAADKAFQKGIADAVSKVVEKMRRETADDRTKLKAELEAAFRAEVGEQIAAAVDESGKQERKRIFDVMVKYKQQLSRGRDRTIVDVLIKLVGDAGKPGGDVRRAGLDKNSRGQQNKAARPYSTQGQLAASRPRRQARDDGR